MRRIYRKKIKELEDRVKHLQDDTIPACRIIAQVPYYGKNVVTGTEASLQDLVCLLLDKLDLKIVKTPSITKLEKI